ncbi:MAG TPA: DUF4142 domain-containing protein [Kaistia sp.]|nr:DUF4142 domain-containing protein [Kaistia sp.]
MRTASGFFAAAGLSVLITCTAAVAAEPITPQAFVHDAGVAGVYEIQAAGIAMSNATRDDIRAFATEMVKDHTAIAAALKASAGSVAVPATVDKAGQAKLDALTAASGRAFDELYVDQQVAAHDGAVTLFSEFADTAPDGTLHDFAEKTLPVLKHHREMVDTLKAELK